MLRPVLAIAALAVLALAPVAESAATLTITIAPTDGHPLDHNVASRTVPENRRLQVPFTVTSSAQEFVCAQEGVFEIDFQTITYPDPWAGASVNPQKAQIRIPPAQPGVGPAPYPASANPSLDVFWADDRPPTGAKQVYTITPTVNDNNVCLPEPTVVVSPSPIRITIFSVDLDTNSTMGPPDCALAPELPECQKATDGGGADASSPGFDVALLIVAAIGLVALVRRRRA